MKGFATAGVAGSTAGKGGASYGWWAAFLHNFVIPNASWIAKFIALGEMAIGIALILGLFTGLAALAGLALNLVYMFTGSAGVNPAYLILEVPLVLAWRNAGWLGLDRFVLNAEWRGRHLPDSRVVRRTGQTPSRCSFTERVRPRQQESESRSPIGKSDAMKALVYHGPNDKSWDDVPDPALVDDTDAIVRVDATTICGSDLHILKGDLPEVTPGRILGHEAVGTVEAVGAAVKNSTRRPGARVVHLGLRHGVASAGRADSASASAVVAGSSATTSTGPRQRRCGCRSPTPRPTRSPPGSSDEEFLMLADILPTGYEVGVLNGGVSPGDVVAVVGAGPIGLSAITGLLCSAPAMSSPSTSPTRGWRRPSSSGRTSSVNNGHEDPVAIVQALTEGLGADVAIEAVGTPRDVRARHRARPARWARGQHRRPRQRRRRCTSRRCGPGT